MSKNERKRLKTAFKLLLILIALFLFMSLIQGFMDSHNALVQKVNQQSKQIDSLQTQLVNVHETSAALNERISLTESKIDFKVDQIEQQPVIITEEVKQEEKRLEPTDPSLVPITIVGAMQVLKGLLFKVPAL